MSRSKPGARPALHQVSSHPVDGTIGVVSFHGRKATGLLVGEEFQINRLQLVSVRSRILPLRDERLAEAIRLGILFP